MIATSIDSKIALVIVPHPDDEALGCAGTLKLLSDAGTNVTLIFVTNGEKLYGDTPDGIVEARRKEAVQSADLLGCSETLFLNFPDGEVGRHSEEVFQRLAGIIRERTPDAIFAPSPIDYHEDHIATSHTGIKLLDEFRSFKLVFYEIYSTVRFNCLVDITGMADLKKQAILNYRTSLYGKPELYVDAALGLNAQRSIFVQRKGYFEAFYIVGKAEPAGSILSFLCYQDNNPENLS